MIECEGLRKVYAGPTGPVSALDGVDLSIGPGEFVAIMGPSGSGKTTLLQILGGIDRPTAGNVRLGDIDYGKLSEDQLTVVRRRRIGYVFQAFNLIPGLTAFENVELSLLLDGEKPSPAQVAAVLDRVGLKARRHHRPTQLSGGEQQRVAIARALLTRPQLILADEPTANLDTATGAQILTLLKEAQKDGAVVVLATHDPQAAAAADRIVRLRDGRIVEDFRVEGASGLVDAHVRSKESTA